MKGNETRVVIFLQPVNPSKEGQMSPLKESKWGFSPFFLFLALSKCLKVCKVVFLENIISSDTDIRLT